MPIDIRQFDGGEICAHYDHDMRFILPLQMRDATREVLTACATCTYEMWKQFPPDKWQQFLEDIAAGKVV